MMFVPRVECSLDIQPCADLNPMAENPGQPIPGATTPDAVDTAFQKANEHSNMMFLLVLSSIIAAMVVSGLLTCALKSCLKKRRARVIRMRMEKEMSIRVDAILEGERRKTLGQCDNLQSEKTLGSMSSSSFSSPSPSNFTVYTSPSPSDDGQLQSKYLLWSYEDVN